MLDRASRFCGRPNISEEGYHSRWLDILQCNNNTCFVPSSDLRGNGLIWLGLALWDQTSTYLCSIQDSHGLDHGNSLMNLFPYLVFSSKNIINQAKYSGIDRAELAGHFVSTIWWREPALLGQRNLWTQAQGELIGRLQVRAQPQQLGLKGRMTCPQQ